MESEVVVDVIGLLLAGAFFAGMILVLVAWTLWIEEWFDRWKHRREE